MNLPRLHFVLIISIAAVFLASTVASSLTNRPQIDEGMFASPALNLATKGHFGTTVLEIENSPLTRINERTYWVMPLFLTNVSASFKLFGMSIFTMRLVSIFWGLVLLAAWYFIALKLSGSRNVALLCLALLACDYTILDTASSGRMDMMSASLGFAGIAVFLVLRERNLLFAVFLSQTLIVLSGLTHPNGILAFFGLAFITLFYDWRNFSLRLFAFAALPFLIGGAAFGWWIAQDFEAFRNQFIDNALMSGRTSGFSSPLAAIAREFTERYPHAYGMGLSSAGHGAAARLKSFILIGYVIGLLGVIFTKVSRQKYKVLLIAVAIYFVVMALIDGQKETPYLVHLVPFYTAFLAIVICRFWEKSFAPKSLLAAAVAAVMILPVAGMALRSRKNTNANLYQPTIDFIKQNASKDDTVMGGAALGFGLGFPDNFVSDGRFGYASGKRPKFIVWNDEAENSWRESEKFYPELYEHIPRLLAEYEVVYENDAFKVYVRRK